MLPALLLGVGSGTTFVPATSLATAGVEPRDAGVASSMVNISQQVGGAVGTALLNTLPSPLPTLGRAVAQYLIQAGQAAWVYSWRVPPIRVRLRMSRRATAVDIPHTGYHQDG